MLEFESWAIRLDLQVLLLEVLTADNFMSQYQQALILVFTHT